VILATGGKWSRPGFAGADLEDVIDTDRLLESERLPAKALLYGLSPWLLEIAQFLKRYGSEVLVATPGKNVLAEESKTITTRLRKGLKDQGIEIRTQAQILSASRKKGGLEVELSAKDGSEKLVVDRVIHAERTASIKGLGLESVGLDPAGPYLRVNEKMETGAEGVYAIGDLTGPPERHYSHYSSEGGMVAAENAMGLEAAVDPRIFSRALFTRPQVACVGLTPREAKKAGHEVLTGAAPFSMNPFGMILAETEGIVEVVADKTYGEILGVHIIGRGACEMIGQAILCIQMEGTLEDLAGAAFPHPTLSESLVEAARDALGRAIYLP
jgi:dihydrolipoamide dehydrogenase